MNTDIKGLTDNLSSAAKKLAHIPDDLSTAEEIREWHDKQVYECQIEASVYAVTSILNRINDNPLNTSDSKREALINGLAELILEEGFEEASKVMCRMLLGATVSHNKTAWQFEDEGVGTVDIDPKTIEHSKKH